MSATGCPCLAGDPGRCGSPSCRNAPPPGSEPLPNVRWERFVELYLQGDEQNATAAYIAAGYQARGNSAEVSASQLLRKPQVAARLAFRRQQVLEEVQAATGITKEAVLRYWWEQAHADPRELVELRRGACRYCHGTDHQYQRTTVELERDLAAHAALEERWNAEKEGRPCPEFQMRGGAGYNANREPHPECPECFGDGVERVIAKDTRTLSPAAARLYGGVKQTANGGLEVKVRDMDAPLVNVAKHLGMFVEKVDAAVSGELTVRFVHE